MITKSVKLGSIVLLGFLTLTGTTAAIVKAFPSTKRVSAEELVATIAPTVQEIIEEVEVLEDDNIEVSSSSTPSPLPSTVGVSTFFKEEEDDDVEFEDEDSKDSEDKVKSENENELEREHEAD